ncbi:hypothetical protein [Gracilibacillus boraciitolerans]|nr:hypothetical protein [Gracilibacillus boraciitolerans]
MIILHDFKINIEDYEAMGKENHFPLLDNCPKCRSLAQGNVHRNGYY